MPSLRNVSVAPWLVRLSQEAGVTGRGRDSLSDTRVITRSKTISVRLCTSVEGLRC